MTTETERGVQLFLSGARKMVAAYSRAINPSADEVDAVLSRMSAPVQCVIGSRIPEVVGYHRVGEGDTSLPGHIYTAPDGSLWERNTYRDLKADPSVKFWRKLDCACGCK